MVYRKYNTQVTFEKDTKQVTMNYEVEAKNKIAANQQVLGKIPNDNMVVRIKSEVIKN